MGEHAGRAGRRALALIVGWLWAGPVCPLSAAIDVARLGNGAAVAIDVRPDSPTDVAAVAFAWADGIAGVGSPQRAAVAAALGECAVVGLDALGVAGARVSCESLPEAVVLWMVGPAGCAPQLADALVWSVTAPSNADLALRAAHASAAPAGTSDPQATVTRAMMDGLLSPGPGAARHPGLQGLLGPGGPELLDRLRDAECAGVRCGASLVGSDAIEGARAALVAGLERLPRGAARTRTWLPPLVPGRIEVSCDAEMTYVGLGYRLPGSDSPEVPGFLILERLLGDGNGSLLFGRLRGELDLTYTVGAELGIAGSNGWLTLWSGCRPGGSEPVLTEMHRVVEGVRSSVDSSDVARARQRAVFEIETRRHRPSRWAPHLASQLATGLDPEYDADLQAALKTWTPDDIVRTARTWLGSALEVVGNPGRSVSRQTNTSLGGEEVADSGGA